MANITNKEAEKKWRYAVSVNGKSFYLGASLRAAKAASRRCGGSVQKLDWFHPSGMLGSIPIWPAEAVERFKNL